MHQGIRALLVQLDEQAAEATRIIYGGSVKGDNAASFFTNGYRWRLSRGRVIAVRYIYEDHCCRYLIRCWKHWATLEKNDEYIRNRIAGFIDY